MVAVPELAAAVSNAGGLGMVTLTWSIPAGDVVRETAALTDRPFCGNLVLTSDQHHRLDEALDAGLRLFRWCPPSWTRWRQCQLSPPAGSGTLAAWPPWLPWAPRPRGWVPDFS